MPGRAPLPRLQMPNTKLPFQTACPNCLARTACSQIACLKLPGDTPSCLASCPYPDFQRPNQSCLPQLPAPAALPGRPVPILHVWNSLVTHPVAWPCARTQKYIIAITQSVGHRRPDPAATKRTLKYWHGGFIQGLIYDVDRVIFAPF